MLGAGSASNGRESLCNNDGAANAAPLPHVTPLSSGERGLSTLADAQRMANETEQLGATIMGQLGQQRGQLNDAIDRRQEAHEQLSVSNRLIRQMHRRATWMRASLGLIILMLIVSLVAFVVIKFVPKSQHHPPPPPPPPPPPGPFYASGTALGHLESSASAVPSAAVGVAAEAVRRALQTTASPPPPLPASTPPPPPLATFSTRNSAAVGPGVIILIVVGGLSVFGCVFSMPKGLAVRFAVFMAGFLLTLAAFLILLLMPRGLPPSLKTTTTKLTDLSTIGRIFLAVLASIFACAALLLVGLTHGFATDKAPALVEPDPEPAFRVAKA